MALSSSPVQEHHIDFLLEEEFSCSSAFLDFFVEAAKAHFKPLSNGLENVRELQPCSEWNCQAVRSVTTDKGETDVLVIYNSDRVPSRVAILIEDKIRAGLRPTQVERYRERGDEGLRTGQWSVYWTCLISPEKYAQDNLGFDTRIPLEKLATFFSGEDKRARFKYGVIQRALEHFAERGLQKEDETMTRFRADYAAEAACFFVEGELNWPKPRPAWWGDQWFNFKRGGIPAGAEIIHKAAAGFIDLVFTNTKVDALHRVLAKCAHPPEIIAQQTGNSASFRIIVKPISDFSNYDAAKATVTESFRRVRDLIAFYNSNKELIVAEIAAGDAG